MTPLRCKRSWLAIWVILLSPAVALAVTVSDLYEAAQPVEGSQEAAFAAALRTVIVRVSGQRDAPERVGAALGNPRQFVQRYGVTVDNMLEVGFDDVSIDQLLLDAGLPVWGRERPLTLVVLKLDELGGSWSSAELPRIDQERLSNAAHARGVPLLWAAIDAQDQNLLSATTGSSSGLLQIAQRYGANALLLGEGGRDTSVRWTLASMDGVAQASGSLEDGAHLTADTFAQVFATTGSSLIHVSVEVAGIADLDAYAATTKYLEGLTLVRNLAVEQVAGDTLRFRLAVRGDAATLGRAIALDDRLIPLAPAGSDATDPAISDAGGRLAFRYRP